MEVPNGFRSIAENEPGSSFPCAHEKLKTILELARHSLFGSRRARHRGTGVVQSAYLMFVSRDHTHRKVVAGRQAPQRADRPALWSGQQLLSIHETILHRRPVRSFSETVIFGCCGLFVVIRLLHGVDTSGNHTSTMALLQSRPLDSCLCLMMQPDKKNTTTKSEKIAFCTNRKNSNTAKNPWLNMIPDGHT